MRIRSSVVVLTALAASAATVAVADIVDFPNTDGSGDLSSAAAWGGTLPATTDTIELNKNYGKTLTFGQSCTFKDLFFTGARTTNTVAITDPDVKVTLQASGTYSGLMAYGTVSYASLTLQGGTYDLNGTGKLCPSASYNSGSTFRNYCQLVLDGVTVTNAASLQYSYGSFGDRFVIRNGSRVYTAAANDMSDSLNDSYPKNAYFEVSGGSKVYANTCISPFGRGMANATFLVTGEGSLVTGTTSSASSLFGSTCSNSHLIVDDHAELDLAYPHIGASNTHDCGIDVMNGGVLRFMASSTVYYPYNATVHDVSINVLNGAELACAGDFNFGYSSSSTKPQGMSLFVSNATFKAKSFAFAGRKGSVRVLGASSSMAGFGSTLFNGADNSLFEFGDGATWSREYPYLSSIGSSNNTFSVVGGATVTFGEFNGVSYHGGDSAHGYTIRIGDGGKIVCAPPAGHSSWQNYKMSGWDNATVVSNGTLKVSGYLSLGIGNTTAETEMTNTRNSLVFQGTTPRVTVTGSSALARGSILRFEVPAQGYPSADPLYTTNLLYLNGGDPIVLELAGFDADFARNLETGFDVVLIKQTFRASLDLRDALGDQVAALAATLPEGVRLYFADSDYELRLSAKPIRGLMFIVR